MDLKSIMNMDPSGTRKDSMPSIGQTSPSGSRSSRDFLPSKQDSTASPTIYHVSHKSPHPPAHHPPLLGNDSRLDRSSTFPSLAKSTMQQQNPSSVISTSRFIPSQRTSLSPLLQHQSHPTLQREAFAVGGRLDAQYPQGLTQAMSSPYFQGGALTNAFNPQTHSQRPSHHSVSPTSASAHTQTPQSLVESPVTGTVFGHAPHMLQSSHNSQPNTPLGPPLAYHRTSSHSQRDQHSPLNHQRTQSGASHGPGPPTPGSTVSLGAASGSPGTYNRPESEGGGYMAQQHERDRSISVSPKTKIPSRHQSTDVMPGVRHTTLRSTSISSPVSADVENDDIQRHVVYAGHQPDRPVTVPGENPVAVRRNTQNQSFSVDGRQLLEQPLSGQVHPQQAPVRPLVAEKLSPNEPHLLPHDFSKESAMQIDTTVHSPSPAKAHSAEPTRLFSRADGSRRSTEPMNLAQQLASSGESQMLPGRPSERHIERRKKSVPKAATLLSQGFHPQSIQSDSLSQMTEPKDSPDGQSVPARIGKIVKKARRYKEPPMWAKRAHSGEVVTLQRSNNKRYKAERSLTPAGPFVPNGLKPNSSNFPMRSQVNGSKREPSVTNQRPYDEVSRELADFLEAYVIVNDGWRSLDGVKLEIEAKVGKLVDTETRERLILPVRTECVLDSSRNPVSFQSSITPEQHKSINKFLNETFSGSQSGGRVAMRYEHTKERDVFYAFSDNAFDYLPNCARNILVPSNRTRIRVTKDQFGKAASKIVKHRVQDLDIYSPRTDFDYRVSINLEFPYTGDVDQLVEATERGNKKERVKDRVTYWHQDYRIDFTQAKLSDLPSDWSHELEIELDENKLWTDGKRDRADLDEYVEGLVNNLRILSRAARES